jgi:hypothetical protein
MFPETSAAATNTAQFVPGLSPFSLAVCIVQEGSQILIIKHLTQKQVEKLSRFKQEFSIFTMRIEDAGQPFGP